MRGGPPLSRPCGEAGPLQSRCQGGGASAGCVTGGRGFFRSTWGRRGFSRPRAEEAGPLQAMCQVGGASAGYVTGGRGFCRPSGGSGDLAGCFLGGGGASAGRGRRGHTAHTQSQAQPSSHSAAILNRGVALSFLRNRFLTAGAAASLTGVCSAGVVSLHCALQATETRPSTKEKKR